MHRQRALRGGRLVADVLVLGVELCIQLTQLVHFDSEKKHLLFELRSFLHKPLDVVGDVVEGHEQDHGTDDLFEHFGKYKGSNSR